MARIEGGRIKLGLFHQTAALLLPQSQSVAVPANLQQIYGFLGPGREWRNTSMSPNFPEVAVATA